MDWRIVDVQRFLLKQGIFWNGNVKNFADRETIAVPVDLVATNGKQVKMTFMQSDTIFEKEVVLKVTDFGFVIEKENILNDGMTTTHICDYSKDWMRYRIKRDPQFAEECGKEAKQKKQAVVEYYDRQISIHEREIEKIKAEKENQLAYWTEIQRAVNNAKKKQVNKRPNPPVDVM